MAHRKAHGHLPCILGGRMRAVAGLRADCLNISFRIVAVIMLGEQLSSPLEDSLSRASGLPGRIESINIGGGDFVMRRWSPASRTADIDLVLPALPDRDLRQIANDIRHDITA